MYYRIIKFLLFIHGLSLALNAASTLEHDRGAPLVLKRDIILASIEPKYPERISQLTHLQGKDLLHKAPTGNTTALALATLEAKAAQDDPLAKAYLALFYLPKKGGKREWAYMLISQASKRLIGDIKAESKEAEDIYYAFYPQVRPENLSRRLSWFRSSESLTWAIRHIPADQRAEAINAVLPLVKWDMSMQERANLVRMLLRIPSEKPEKRSNTCQTLTAITQHKNFSADVINCMFDILNSASFDMVSLKSQQLSRFASIFFMFFNLLWESPIEDVDTFMSEHLEDIFDCSLILGDNTDAVYATLDKYKGKDSESEELLDAFKALAIMRTEEINALTRHVDTFIPWGTEPVIRSRILNVSLDIKPDELASVIEHAQHLRPLFSNPTKSKFIYNIGNWAADPHLIRILGTVASENQTLFVDLLKIYFSKNSFGYREEDFLTDSDKIKIMEILAKVPAEEWKEIIEGAITIGTEMHPHTSLNSKDIYKSSEVIELLTKIPQSSRQNAIAAATGIFRIKARYYKVAENNGPDGVYYKTITEYIADKLTVQKIIQTLKSYLQLEARSVISCDRETTLSQAPSAFTRLDGKKISGLSLVARPVISHVRETTLNQAPIVYTHPGKKKISAEVFDTILTRAFNAFVSSRDGIDLIQQDYIEQALEFLRDSRDLQGLYLMRYHRLFMDNLTEWLKANDVPTNRPMNIIEDYYRRPTT